jgi:hypothetical protein
MKVLSPEPSLDEAVDTVGMFKTRLRNVRYLRDRLKNLLRHSTKPAALGSCEGALEFGLHAES